MSVLRPAELRLAEAVSQLGYCNPFLPDRIHWERVALGAEFDERYAQWNLQSESPLSPNIERLVVGCEAMLDEVRGRVRDASRLAGQEALLYDDVLMFVLFHRFRERIPGAQAARSSSHATRQLGAVYEQLLAAANRQLTFGQTQRTLSAEFPHVFAVFFQLRRAFDNIFQFIIGVSQPAVALRAAVWQSIFTHDMRRYGRVLFDRMGDYTTLVMGPSGTGKELVARAVGLSRYIPFDAQTRTFQADSAQSFFPISLSAMSPTLIESELFGHKRGAFTGAVGDRAGWLEVCPPHGCVFLDEIGELEPAIQVKLLRVLQARSFSRLGETEVRQFQGKIVAATNRNLDEEMCAGRFRQDLYYRLCSDIIHVSSLHQRIAADPAELHQLVAYISHRMVGEEGPRLAAEVESWIQAHLGPDYPWPGNVRELEQCIRNVLIRKEYVPPRARRDTADDPLESIRDALWEGRMTADQLVRWYCTLSYARTGSYEATARQLQLDRRTVKAKVDPSLLPQLQGARAGVPDDTPSRQ